MTFEQYYIEVTKIAQAEDNNETKNYVMILWRMAYTIEQAVHSVKTMYDEE